MKIKDLFFYKYGVNLELLRCDLSNDESGVNFVSRTSNNNGVVARVKYIKGIKPQKAGTLSLATSGSVLSCFVQKEDYYSGRDLYVLTPKIDLSFEQKLFYSVCISKNSYRYSYGRAANKTFANIEIPTLDECNRMIANIKFRPILSNNNGMKLTNVNDWKQFKISELFIVSGTKTTPVSILEEKGVGFFPYVTTQSSNNGVAGFYNFYTEEGNVIVIDSAVTGFASYHEKRFSASDHVEKLTPLFKIDKFIAIFLVTLLNRERYKFSYGRKANHKKISELILKLPTDENDYPDWNYMRTFVKSLYYGDKI